MPTNPSARLLDNTIIKATVQHNYHAKGMKERNFQSETDVLVLTPDFQEIFAKEREKETTTTKTKNETQKTPSFVMLYVFDVDDEINRNYYQGNNYSGYVV